MVSYHENTNKLEICRRQSIKDIDIRFSININYFLLFFFCYLFGGTDYIILNYISGQKQNF